MLAADTDNGKSRLQLILLRRCGRHRMLCCAVCSVHSHPLSRVKRMALPLKIRQRSHCASRRRCQAACEFPPQINRALTILTGDQLLEQGEPDGAPAEDPAEVTNRIAAALPSSREAVFAHPIDWAMFDAAKATLAPRLSAWVDKKIQDMLGEREESMVRIFTSPQIAWFA